MTEKYKSLARRREELVTKSTLQREQFASMVADVWQPGAVSTGRHILSQARQRPFVSVLMAVLLLLFFRRRRLFPLLATGVVTFKTWTQIAPHVMPFLTKLWRYYREKRQSR
jgi:hypothetical protein